MLLFIAIAGAQIDYLKLDKLEIAKGAGFDPNKACLDGTRVAILDKVREWIEGKGEHGDARMFLLVGQAGLGKSAIAHSISHEYEQIRCLGATYCFSKDRGSTNFFRTIARKLADLDPAYAACLCETMTEDMENTTSMPRQLQNIFLRPFESSLSVLGPIVIVVDALDECVDSDRAELIRLLTGSIQSFPSNIRLLITSRPNEVYPLRKHEWVQVHDLNAELATYQDILLFVKHQLKTFPQSDCELVASSSECVFQYASVVCREICSAYLPGQTYESPKQVFSRLVTRRGADTGLDGLYKLILANAYHKFGSYPEALRDFRRVMGRIIVAQHQLTKAALVDYERFMGDIPVTFEDGYDPVSKTLYPLSALLSGTQNSSDTVYPLHSSFRDFLLDQNRSGDFCIGSENNHHLSITTASLRLMNCELQFNIAGLESSYIPNRKVPDFEQQVHHSISRSLSYACVHWTTHLSLSNCKAPSFSYLDLVATLFETKFLYWLEVLGLEHHIAFAETSCEFLLEWLMVSCNT